MKITRKLLPLLAAVQLAIAGIGAAQAAYLSVGYFNGGGDVTAGPGGDIDKLDVTQITHLNYSFGLIYNDEKDETNAALKDPARRHQIYLSPKVTADLQRLPVLRKQNPELKELHQALGQGKLLTIAVGANVKSPQEWVDVKSIAPYLDYINLMTYDMAYGTQYFNANLYDSTRWPTVAAADRYSADFVVKHYLAAGLKPAQMNLGIGFYGRVPKRATEAGIDWDKPDAAKHPVTQPDFSARETALFNALGLDLSKDTYFKYHDIVSKLLNDPQHRFREHWDDDAKVPYLTLQSAEGKPLFAISYENPRSVAIKAEYIKSQGLGGAMFWEYGADDNNRLAQQLAESLGIKGEKR
ncbi:glycoside hydrolase family 18 protein [Serratia bockelmannii]|uniref:glycoside hydrolase family 18 protein n=1 Tax=Serratia bockelmannii TaxID=2703793 RepID=UPI003C2DFE0D